MAETITKIAVALVLDDGTDSQGNPKTVSTSMPSLNKTYYDDTSALSVIGAAEACLNKSITQIKKTTTSSISAS